MEIEVMHTEDWEAVRRIYEDGIAEGKATFETGAPAYHAWDMKHLPQARLVSRTEEGLQGWAALSPVSERCVHGGVAEVSIYVAHEARGRGVGRALLEALVLRSEELGIWTLQAGVFPENRASLRLHQACGFRVVGVRERLGKLRGEWKDVVLLERRSPDVGV